MKHDKILDECWQLKYLKFANVRKALDDLVESLIECATERGVPLDVARDTYYDWVRSHMETASFMT